MEVGDRICIFMSISSTQQFPFDRPLFPNSKENYSRLSGISNIQLRETRHFFLKNLT